MHSNFVTTPFNSIFLVESYSAANEWCASIGIPAISKPAAVAKKRGNGKGMRLVYCMNLHAAADLARCFVAPEIVEGLYPGIR